MKAEHLLIREYEKQLSESKKEMKFLVNENFELKHAVAILKQRLESHEIHKTNEHLRKENTKLELEVRELRSACREYEKEKQKGQKLKELR